MGHNLNSNKQVYHLKRTKYREHNLDGSSISRLGFAEHIAILIVSCLLGFAYHVSFPQQPYILLPARWRPMKHALRRMADLPIQKLLTRYD